MLGLYISVPFCRTKCSFCNFASGPASRGLHERYVEYLEGEIAGAEQIVRGMDAEFERNVDSLYLGGGTPSVLAPDHFRRVFSAVRANFEVTADAEITVECAPSTLSGEMIGTLVACGVNRVSLGVQSFVDQESRAVGRLHTREVTLKEIARLREAGISEISIDLIAGLPYQTVESWTRSLEDLVAAGVPHASVYMLEVDDESRLGRELIAGGTRYHAHHVPDDDLTADLYVQACETLNAVGVRQYEISNFARDGHESRHNMKYWLRHPYLGFGVDAHSMLAGSPRLAPESGRGSWGTHEAVRAQTADELEPLLASAPRKITRVDEKAAIEETYFLGLRLVRGVNLGEVRREFGDRAVERYKDAICEMQRDGLAKVVDERLRLTLRGRLLSNDVFSRFLVD